MNWFFNKLLSSNILKVLFALACLAIVAFVTWQMVDAFYVPHHSAEEIWEKLDRMR